MTLITISNTHMCVKHIILNVLRIFNINVRILLQIQYIKHKNFNQYFNQNGVHTRCSFFIYSVVTHHYATEAVVTKNMLDNIFNNDDCCSEWKFLPNSCFLYYHC